jgi:5-methylcytosine-specific restriction endonuclease McrA
MKSAFTCDHCGKTHEGRFDKRRRFCDRRCIQSHAYIPRPRQRSIDVPCLTCGKIVHVMPWRQKKYKKHFCCAEHAHEYRRNNTLVITCGYCEKPFKTTPSAVRLRNRKNCSKKCHFALKTRAARERHASGVVTQHQIDRALRYCKEAIEWRNAVFERDDYTCQRCGERGGYLEAHHDLPFAYFPEQRFELLNGMTLCRPCHDLTRIGHKRLRAIYALQGH